jgi:uncharacterized protein YfaS (alpha-2-macroglobulin family)
MEPSLWKQTGIRICFGFVAALLVLGAALLTQTFLGADGASGTATYSHGILHLAIPYHADHRGTGKLTAEVLDPDDHVLGKIEKSLEVAEGSSLWKEQVRLDKPLPLDELVWNRVRYRFQYQDNRFADLQGTESISQLLRMPVLHILAQQSYLEGSRAAVRVVVTDSRNEAITGRTSLRIDLQAPGQKKLTLFTGQLNHRNTAEVQFLFPAGLAGNCELHYVVDTSLGSTEYTQTIRIQDKVGILLTTEKPIYQPGQMIHARALALDRADHEAVANRALVFEVEDSRGNKVFKKATRTDEFGIGSAEFELASEVNLGTYHLRAVLVEAGSESANSAEIALHVEKYVLPKFKVDLDFTSTNDKKKHGYRPGDHVRGTVQANYFFGKPLDTAEVSIKATGMDVTTFLATSVKGKTDHDGAYHFDLQLPGYLAGRPLSQGAARLLVEAIVKDSAGHSETRGEPITVSESAFLITAVPEGGTLIPGLENQVFLLASYPDGSPVQAELKVRSTTGSDQSIRTDEGGVAVINVRTPQRGETLQIEGKDNEGETVSATVSLQLRAGDEQVLLRSERAVYRSGDAIHLKVLTTRKHGTAYVDIVKEGQTIQTRDLDINDGAVDLTLVAGPEMAGTVDINAYVFGQNAQPVADHRLIFVQPADELKIETVADAPVYKPGDDTHIRFHITDAHGQGVHAALGLQIVDEAVFALAEKQPGFAKVFFYLEQEVMKPRYEIHSIGLPEVVEPVSQPQEEQRDRAARALFAATEIVSRNKFETEVGRTVPQAKYYEYSQRYWTQFRTNAEKIAGQLRRSFADNPKQKDLLTAFEKLSDSDAPEFRDPWGTRLTLEAVPWDPSKTQYIIRSAGMDKQFKTGDDMVVPLYFRRNIVVASSAADKSEILPQIEHDRGPNNGRAEISGKVVDPSGAVVANAVITAKNISTGHSVTIHADAEGKFGLTALRTGKYQVQVSSPGFRLAEGTFQLEARDHGELGVRLLVGATTQTVEVTGASVLIETSGAGFGMAGGVPGGVAGGVIGGVISDRGDMRMMALPAPKAMPLSTRNVKRSEAAVPDQEASPGVHVRSYFPEALYINPEIITDRNGNASISIPLADNITTWRMAMLASTQHGALGSATSSLKVFQDFFVDLDLPVTLTQGDQVSIPVAIYNYSEAKGDVHLQLNSGDWFSLVDDTAQKSVSVDAGHVGGSQFTLEARRIGKFKLTVSAQLSGTSKRADVVVREIEVVPNGREQSMVFNGQLESAVSNNLEFPPSSIPDASKIFVRLYPGPLSQIMEGMDSLLRMPGGCFEQTSSSTYPNVLALDYMKRTKKLTPEVHAKAEGYIANGYQRLLTFEVPGGGFSWFGQAPANKILTAYGLMEFYDMSKVHDVDPRLIQRTQQWLAAQQLADGSWKPDTSFINEGATNRYNSDVLRITAYIAWSLGNTGYQGPAIEKASQFIHSHLSAKMDAYTLAVLGNFTVDYGKDRDLTRQAMQLLLDARTEKGEQVWWSAEETSVYATRASATIETTGLAVQALLKWGQASGTARKALSYITAKKDATGAWGSTQATIMALRALLLASEKGTADVRGTVEIVINGKAAGKLTLTPDNNDLLHQFVFTDIDANGTNVVELRFEGSGALGYQAAGQYFIPWDERPENEPLSISVNYDRTKLAQDDIVAATAIVRNNLTKTAKMVMVDLGIPPGFDLLTEDLQDYQEKSASRKSGRLEKFNLTATQAILYFDSFAPSDTTELRFRLRAKYPIRARTFQSRVYEYYDPEVNSVARPVQLDVRKR